MNKQIILVASFLGLTAVILGAFGAHGLDGKISDYHLGTWKTANQYHFYHTLALLFLSTFSRAKNASIRVSFFAFVLGIFLFSGSLYLMSIRSLIGMEGLSMLGPITPLGGLCFIVGWIGLFVAALRNRH
ncbi:DUF423 domain-containing protein [Sphingobacterium paludis]|jgi:uncharacterized membrane protein YgdD (TMEM256/DUF423 family)|uniref:Uncharacterized membrane protein YgdD (TMEM256/DUF423 family) n=1 Tax=Sphingobacterium paludis TaxID=1476465 RepID=A0A4R7D4V6_9SPHI|nr:DUF423 domain-containing protein [Sphingobacterium paludis]TDS16119.1 uncharacterized membrane protein YgdD (TMEM256/DUF423 family) [Sphingobacterium paludis]